MQYAQRLDELERRYEELTAKMADSSVVNDQAEYRKVSKARSELEDIVAKYREWKSVNKNLTEARGMLQESDAELRAMAQEEAARLEPELAKIEGELKILLLPKDPLDAKYVVLDIRAGTGGDEATLFAAVLLRMYGRFVDTLCWIV